MSDNALLLECFVSGPLSVGDAIVFDNVEYSSGTISYNTSTGVITFNEAGRYIINWHVATLASASISGAVFILTNSQGDFQLSASPIKTGEVSGTGILDVVSPPVTAILINGSSNTFYFPPNLLVLATLVIVQDDIAGAGPTGPTGPFGSTGATGPTGPTGPEAGSTLMEASLVAGEESDIADAAAVLFNTIRIQAGSISYAPMLGLFTIGETGYYLVNWWVATDGAGASPTITFVLRLNGSVVSSASTPNVTGQIGGTALILVSTAPATLSLNNNTGEAVFLPSILTQAGITITRVGPSS